MVELRELVVENERNGLLVLPADSLVLTSANERICQDAALWQRLEVANYAERQFRGPAITHACWRDRSCKMVEVILRGSTTTFMKSRNQRQA
jgi:hypothetical protein